MGYADDNFVRAFDEYVEAKVETAVTEAIDNNSTLVTGDDFNDHLTDAIGYMANPTDWFDMDGYVTDDDLSDRMDDRYVRLTDFDEFTDERIAKYLGQDFTLSDLVTLTERVAVLETTLARVHHTLNATVSYEAITKRRNGEVA